MLDQFFYVQGVFPPLRRVRGFYAYSMNNQRYCDLFLNHASAVLGHVCPGYHVVLKNTLEQGMYVPYPNLWYTRLQKAVALAFPGYTVHYYNTNPYPTQICQEPWQHDGTLVWWRPAYIKPDARMLVLMLPVAVQPCWIILTSSDVDMPPSHIISAVQSRLALKALQAWPIAQKLDMTHEQRQWFGANFCTYGPYFHSTLSQSDHLYMVEQGIQQGIILPPQPHLTGFLSPAFSHGQQQAIRNLLSGS